MATFQAETYQKLKDPETGCVAYGTENLEQCKQTFYLKQQNEILREQQGQGQLQQENAELKSEIQVLRQEIETLKASSAEQAASPQNAQLAATLASTPAFYITGAVIIIAAATYFIARKLSSN